ncbi:MAG: EamA family transporter RarD [Rhizobiaceae bacterium]|nr:EamA family transporter RarD [Hyphomicrobiales bacterium]NRB31327.1 EamA family transporter RarD [Rhizobiaceae bacterium]
MTTQSQKRQSISREGFLYAFFAYTLWGFLPFYFKAVEHIPAVEMVAHRVIWSVPVALVVIGAQRRLGELISLFRNGRIVLMMSITALLVSLNWGVYIWSIAINKASEAALGYYINPLITVFLGFALLGEKMTRLQALAVGIAVAAVLIRTVGGGVFPWIALTLAFSFAAYGYLRKTVDVGPTQGFLVEVVLLSPLAIAYLVWLIYTGDNHFTMTTWTGPYLMFAGLATAVPLILYAFGAKLLPLQTLGLMQYIAPSLIFLVSFLAFGEELDFWQGVTFVMIWSALIIYTWSLFKQTD